MWRCEGVYQRSKACTKRLGWCTLKYVSHYWGCWWCVCWSIIECERVSDSVIHTYIEAQSEGKYSPTLFIYSLIHSLAHSLTHSLNHTHTNSTLTHSLTHSLFTLLLHLWFIGLWACMCMHSKSSKEYKQSQMSEVRLWQHTQRQLYVCMCMYAGSKRWVSNG